jgi:sarcosine oxidase
VASGERAFDVIVVGLGAHGSATAYQLAQRGVRVLGIEAFGRAHQLGSSGGRTRVIRLAYFEHPDYVPLLRAAWELWPRLEQEAGEGLLRVTGGLYCGRRGSSVLEGSLASAREHDLPHELLTADEVGRRHPALRLDEDMAALYEPLAGILEPEKCIAAHLALAERHDALLQFDERVTGWSAVPGEPVRVHTAQGSYAADRLVLSVGAWLPTLVPELAPLVRVERQPLFWFEPVGPVTVLGPDRLPVYIVELDAEHAFYGFPYLAEQGIKVARHHGGRPTAADTVEREADADDEAPVRDFMAHYLPAANGRRLDARVCMYTNTPDYNFVIDFHPQHERVVIVSACSGHGFKFSNVIGQIVADLALSGRTEYPIAFLALDRFANMIQGALTSPS